MSTAYEIPLQPFPQELEISLGGTGYVMVMKWCWPSECWMMDIYDGQTYAPLLLGTPLVTGADLLAQFRHLGIPGELVVQTDHDTLTPPTFENLGVLSHLFYIPLEQG